MVETWWTSPGINFIIFLGPRKVAFRLILVYAQSSILYQSSNTFNLCTFFNHVFFCLPKKRSLYTNRGCFTVDSHSGTAMLPTATSANVNKALGISACDPEHLGQSWEDLTTIATWTCHTASHSEGGSFLLGTSKAFEYVSILHSMESVTEFQPSIHSSLIREL